MNAMPTYITVPQDASTLTLFAHVEYVLQALSASGRTGLTRWQARYNPAESFVDMRFAAQGLFDVVCTIGPVETRNVRAFRRAYTASLSEALDRYPHAYAFTLADVPLRVEAMILAFKDGKANHGPALSAALRACGMKDRSRRAREAWINAVD